jgi:hypothetical protein
MYKTHSFRAGVRPFGRRNRERVTAGAGRKPLFLLAKGVLARVRDVEEPVLVLVLGIDVRHEFG